MTSPYQPGVSDTARLLADAPGFAVGWQEIVYLQAPAAGAQWSYTVPGGFWARLVSVRQVLVTSAVVANRVARLQLRDANAVTITAVAASGAVPAATTVATHNVLGAADVGNGVAPRSYGYLPSVLIPAGWSWGSQVAAMDAGDAFTTVTLVIQRFPDDAASVTAGT